MAEAQSQKIVLTVPKAAAAPAPPPLPRDDIMKELVKIKADMAALRADMDTLVGAMREIQQSIKNIEMIGLRSVTRTSKGGVFT